MKPEEARKLLGGYATGTLTPGEQQALFAAALEDQSLFDALAGEQALKEVLDEPGARAELLDAVTSRRWGWFRWWPAPVGAVALAMAALTIVVLVRKEPAKEMVAGNRSVPAQAAPAVETTRGKPVAPAKAVSQKPEPKPMERQFAQPQAEPRKAKGEAVADSANAPAEPATPARSLEVSLDAVKAKEVPGTAASSAFVQPEQAVIASPPSLPVVAPAPAAPALAIAAPAAKSKKEAVSMSVAQRMFETGSAPPAPTTLRLRPMGALGGAVRARASADRAEVARGQADAAVWTGPGLKYAIAADGAITAESNFDGFLQSFRRENGVWKAHAPAAAVKAHEPVIVSRDAAVEVVLVLAPRERTAAEVEGLRFRETRLLRGDSGDAHYAAVADTSPDAMIVVTIRAGQK